MADRLISAAASKDPDVRGRRPVHDVSREAPSTAFSRSDLEERVKLVPEERLQLTSEDEQQPKRSGSSLLVPLALAALCTGLVACAAVSLLALFRPLPAAPKVTCAAAGASRGPMPAGANFGGWLVLEDWFFSGQDGRYVTSADPQGQGACLPPLARGTLARWPSEGVLASRLNKTYGRRKAVDIISAHRHSYIGEHDLALLADLGIHQVRLPLTWAAFADALAPLSAEAYGSHNATTDTTLVPDPFHVGNVTMTTVPRGWLGQFLRRAGKHGLRVVFDMHSMPGGSSDGTYNGVWPHEPAFWTANAVLGGGAFPLRTVGLWVVAALIGWIESLDKEARTVVSGITVMNEPAHMAASLGFAEEREVLSWIEAAADLFRQSSLPKQGLKLYVNMIETGFMDFWGTVGPWWHNVFSKAEREKWAVFDVHWYTAWDGGRCDGRVLPGGGYLCDAPLAEARRLLRGCARGFTEVFASHIHGLKSCSEFSTGTFADAVLACNDRTLLQAFLEEQVSVFQSAEVESFFWTWRMPYGPSFQMGWSLKHLLGHEDAFLQSPCSLPLGVM